MSDILAGLNPAQREAVGLEGGPALVLAGPGSGKTRVLTHRVAWLLSRGIPDRQILALIKEFLDAELGWSNETFGWVNGAFQLAYAVGLLLFGWFVDRFGTKIGYATSIVLWSLSAIGHAFVGSVNGFFAARVALGVSEGGTTADRRFTFETVACLGTCFLAPVIMVDDDYYGDVRPAKIGGILARYE